MTKNEKMALCGEMKSVWTDYIRVKNNLDTKMWFEDMKALSKDEMEKLVSEKSAYARGYMHACSIVLALSMPRVEAATIVHGWTEEAEEEYRTRFDHIEGDIDDQE